MGIIVPEGYSNVSFVHQIDGSIKQAVASVGCFKVLSGDPDPTEIANDFWGYATNVAGPCIAAAMSDAWTFVGVSVTSTVDGLPLTGQKFTSVAGSSSGDSVMLNTSVLITKNTAAGGRKNRGRMYWPPSICFEGSADSAGNITGGNEVDFTNMFEHIRTAAQDDDYVLTLFHSDATTPTPIISLSCESRLATQRRRMR